MSSTIEVSAINYPDSDGRPMGETDEHRDAMVRHIELLRYRFRNQRVYVSGDLLVYYEPQNPKKFVVPDAFVVKGIDPKKRRIFKIWVEGRSPDAVIETTSRKTKRKDMVTKPELYARLGVKEYFMFDPTQEYLDPPLQGYRLESEQYVAISADADGALSSSELGLRFKLEHGQLEFYDPATNERLLTAEERSTRDREACKAAEAELERLRAELRTRDSKG